MPRRPEHASRRRQQGWVALIGLVLALVIVALLVRTVMDQYGLTRKPGTAAKATGLGPVDQDMTVAPAPRDAMERARSLEAQVQRQAADQAKRIDDAIKQ